MGLANFTPALWAAEILVALDKAHRYSQPGVVNRDYEGEITAEGDRVKINSVGDVTISTYSKDTDINDPEALMASQQELIIDQAKYFNFAVDDVDRVQNNVDVLTEAARRAAYGLRNTADIFLGTTMKNAIGTSNSVGSESSPKTDLGTAGNAYEYLVDLQVILDENETPMDNRWCIVPPWFHGNLQEDSRFTGYGTDMNMEIVMNGMVGRAAGFDILVSNNVPSTTSTTKFKIIAGHSIATSYAEQIVSVEAYRPEKRFSEAVKGLHVYGAKVVRPSNLAMLVANRPS
jgi:hypothetical protein